MSQYLHKQLFNAFSFVDNLLIYDVNSDFHGKKFSLYIFIFPPPLDILAASLGYSRREVYLAY